MSVEWLRDRLNESNVGDVRELRGFSEEPISDGRGFAARTVRLHLDWGDTIQDDRHDALERPGSIILKTHAANPEMARFVGDTYRKETFFYQTLALDFPIAIPHCYFVEHDSDTGHFALLLEDVPGDAGDQVSGGTIKQARQVVGTLAELHAAYWGHAAIARSLDNDQHVTSDESDVSPAQVLEVLGMVRTENTRTGGIGRNLLSAIELVSAIVRLTETAQREPRKPPTPRSVIKQKKRMQKRQAREARSKQRATEKKKKAMAKRTLVHGDFRLDNLLFLPDQQIVTIDWGPRFEESGIDLASYISGSLLPEQIRAEGRNLIDLYVSEMAQREIKVSAFKVRMQCVVVAFVAGLFGSIARTVTQPGLAQMLPAAIKRPGLFDFVAGITGTDRGTVFLDNMIERAEVTIEVMQPRGSRTLIRLLTALVSGVERVMRWFRR